MVVFSIFEKEVVPENDWIYLVQEAYPRPYID